MLEIQNPNAGFKPRTVAKSPYESWRYIPLPGLDRYQASNLGSIRYKRGNRVNLIAVQCAPSARYPAFSYWDHRTCERRTIRLHRAVCAAWHGLPPSQDAIAEHRDDDPLNCRAKNLHWSTRRHNHRTAQKRGTVPGIGVEMAEHIRQAYRPTRARVRELHQEFGISRSAVRLILRGVSYAELGGPVPGYRGRA